MKKWICLLLLSCTSVQADMLDALKAYEQKDYTAAAQQFAELLPLGNEMAAFNLGAMAYQGEGQEQDLPAALAYFMFAADLKHAQAAALVTKIKAVSSPQQLTQAEARFNKLQQAVLVKEVSLEAAVAREKPTPIRRVEPKYPVAAARQGVFGYVKLRFLVDEAGKVAAIDTLDAYPEKVFNKSAIKAVRRWQYQATGSKHLMDVRLDYSLDDGDTRVSVLEKIAHDNKLWQYAVAGVPQHQFVLGTLLSLMEVQSHNGFWYDPDLPLSPIPDFTIYKNRPHLTADLEGFWGYAVVRVNKDGTITEQLRTEFEPQNQLTSLIGLKLEGQVEAEVYRLYRQSSSRRKNLSIVPSIPTSRSMSGHFWWEQAAKNGNLDAQRVMAAYDRQWEQYLLNQQDAEVMAWAGTRLMLEGQREQGIALLEQAIAKNYAPAKEMKQQFM